MSVDNSNMTSLLQLQVVTMQQNNRSLNALNAKNATLNATISQNLNIVRENMGLQAQVIALINIMVVNISTTRQLGILLVDLTRVLNIKKNPDRIADASIEFHAGMKSHIDTASNVMQSVLTLMEEHGSIDPSSGGGSKPQGKSSLWDLTKNLGKSSVKKSISAFGGVVKGMPGAVGAMAASALIMQPFMAMVGGFLEPFSMFTDTFGAFGTILGTAFYPILIPINNVLIQMIPYLVVAAEWLGKTGMLFGSFGVAMQIFKGDLYGLKDNFATFGTDMVTTFKAMFTMENWSIEGVIGDLFIELGKTLITLIGTMIIDVYEGLKEDVEEFLGID